MLIFCKYVCNWSDNTKNLFQRVDRLDSTCSAICRMSKKIIVLSLVLNNIQIRTSYHVSWPKELIKNLQ